MSGRFAVRFVAAILLMLALEPARAADKVVPPDFSGYPQTESFKAYLSFQTNVACHLQQTNFLAISTFPDGGRYALEYMVAESGQEYDWREVYDWASQASHRKQLSEAELKSLHAAIHDLPTGNTSPPLERLVIVSFCEGTHWVTRIYDSGTLPKPVRRIYDIIGERFESRRAQ